MAGAMQSEYQCSHEAWLRSLEHFVQQGYLVEPKALLPKESCFEIKADQGTKRGLWIDILDESSNLYKVTLHWLLKTSGPEPLSLVVLANMVEEKLMEEGAVCLFGKVKPFAQRLLGKRKEG